MHSETSGTIPNHLTKPISQRNLEANPATLENQKDLPGAIGNFLPRRLKAETASLENPALAQLTAQ